MIYVLLIATEPPLRGRVAIHCTSKLGVCTAIEANVVLTGHLADRVIELAFVFCAHVAQVRTGYLPESGSLVYSSVTTDVDKLGLKANTVTKESKDVGIFKLSTDVVFLIVDTELVITASGSPVGGYTSLSDFILSPVSR